MGQRKLSQGEDSGIKFREQHLSDTIIGTSHLLTFCRWSSNFMISHHRPHDENVFLYYTHNSKEYI